MPVTVVQCLNCEKEVAERWERGAVGAEGREMGRGVPPQPTRGSGERRKLPSGVRGGAPAENEFDVFCGR